MKQIGYSLGLAFILGVFIFVPSAQAQTDPAPGPEQIYKAIDQISEIVYRKYGLVFLYKKEQLDKIYVPSAHYQNISEEELPALLRYITLLSEEIYRYPPEFFGSVHLAYVGLVKKLFHNEKPAEGIYSPGAKIMLFDYYRSRANEVVQRHSIQHEFFHMIESNNLDKHWQNWEQFNEKGFQYSEKYEPVEEGLMAGYESPFSGFVTKYAMTKPQEDRAEVFGCLMVPVQQRLINRWAQKDPILRKKVASIKELIGQIYPAMNKDYWKKLLD